MPHLRHLALWHKLDDHTFVLPSMGHNRGVVDCGPGLHSSVRKSLQCFGSVSLWTSKFESPFNHQKQQQKFQMADTTGPKTMFLISTVFTAVYYIGLGFGRCWYSFFFLQILRIGYQLDATVEMYLATITTERERTSALMVLTIPQAISMFFAPIIASKVAVYTTLRISQMINGVVLAAILVPILLFFLPTTHSIPKLATARLRPQVREIVIASASFKSDRQNLSGLLANDHQKSGASRRSNSTKFFDCCLCLL